MVILRDGHGGGATLLRRNVSFRWGMDRAIAGSEDVEVAALSPLVFRMGLRKTGDDGEGNKGGFIVLQLGSV